MTNHTGRASGYGAAPHVTVCVNLAHCTVADFNGTPPHGVAHAAWPSVRTSQRPPPRPGKQGRRPDGLKFLAVCTRVKVASTECVTAEICAVTHSALYWAHHGSPPSAPAPQQADCFHQYKRNPTPQSADCLELPEPSTALGGCVRSTKTSTIPL